jgi:hypothetical protein
MENNKEAWEHLALRVARLLDVIAQSDLKLRLEDPQSTIEPDADLLQQ